MSHEDNRNRPNVAEEEESEGKVREEGIERRRRTRRHWWGALPYQSPGGCLGVGEAVLQSRWRTSRVSVPPVNAYRAGENMAATGRPSSSTRSYPYILGPPAR